MKALKNIIRNRFMMAALAAGTLIASTGCDQLNALRNMMSTLTPGIPSPFDAGFGGYGGLGDFGDLGLDDYGYGDDYWF